MSTRKFSIFSVYDYKGGELRSSTNLSEEEFYGQLADLVEHVVPDVTKLSVEEIQSKLEELCNKNDFESSYAGGDGFCGEMYEHIGGELSTVEFIDFLPQVASFIKKNWE